MSLQGDRADSRLRPNPTLEQKALILGKQRRESAGRLALLPGVDPALPGNDDVLEGKTWRGLDDVHATQLVQPGQGDDQGLAPMRIEVSQPAAPRELRYQAAGLFGERQHGGTFRGLWCGQVHRDAVGGEEDRA